MHVIAGHEVVDSGAVALIRGDDYPDFVIPLARAVAGAKVERGVAISGSGVGASACASKVSGERRSDPRPLLGLAGCRGRPHEHCVYGRQDRRIGRSLGSRRDFPGVQIRQAERHRRLSVRWLPSKHRQSANKAQLTTHERPAWSRTRRYHEAEVRPNII
jgi:ribose 5-phosphate isomerase B